MVADQLMAESIFTLSDGHGDGLTEKLVGHTSITEFDEPEVHRVVLVGSVASRGDVEDVPGFIGSGSEADRSDAAVIVLGPILDLVQGIGDAGAIENAHDLHCEPFSESQSLEVYL